MKPMGAQLKLIDVILQQRQVGWPKYIAYSKNATYLRKIFLHNYLWSSPDTEYQTRLFLCECTKLPYVNQCGRAWWFPQHGWKLWCENCTFFLEMLGFHPLCTSIYKGKHSAMWYGNLAYIYGLSYSNTTAIIIEICIRHMLFVNTCVAIWCVWGYFVGCMLNCPGAGLPRYWPGANCHSTLKWCPWQWWKWCSKFRYSIVDKSWLNFEV